MAEKLTASVRREINRLQKEINERTSQLASLGDELIKHQRAYRLLEGTDRRARRPRRTRAIARRTAPVDWNSVLQGLPGRFTIGDIAKVADAKGKSPVYRRQIAVRWAKEGKTRRVGRGNYEKVQQAKPRATARRRRK
jgi:hypothetical protein